MPLVILRHLLNVSVQLANKKGLKKINAGTHVCVCVCARARVCMCARVSLSLRMHMFMHTGLYILGSKEHFCARVCVGGGGEGGEDA
jgi:hypothetical protein